MIGTSTPVVRLYTKKECSLCDKAKVVIDAAAKERNFRLEIVDVEGDRELMKDYGEQIPVIFINDRKAFKFKVGIEELINKLDRSAR